MRRCKSEYHACSVGPTMMPPRPVKIAKRLKSMLSALGLLSTWQVRSPTQLTHADVVACDVSRHTRRPWRSRTKWIRCDAGAMEEGWRQHALVVIGWLCNARSYDTKTLRKSAIVDDRCDDLFSAPPNPACSYSTRNFGVQDYDLTYTQLPKMQYDMYDYKVLKSQPRTGHTRGPKRTYQATPKTLRRRWHLTQQLIPLAAHPSTLIPSNPSNKHP